MTYNEALEIIKNNVNSNNESLLYYTHEKTYFNSSAFWKLYNAVKIIVEFSKKEDPIDRLLTFKIVKSLNYFTHQIIWHYDKSDMYVMINAPKNITQFSNRLNIAVEAYLCGIPISDKTEMLLNEDLRNEVS